MHLSGKNFQPWADFDMDIEGLTVLVGPSNKGKSSLFRALKGVMRNDIPEDFVRNKQDEPLEITLQVGDTTVHAIRPKGKSVKYTISHPTFDKPKVYSSLNGKVPEEVAKLGFGEVKVGDYTVDPIFSNQNKAQFLIDSDRWKPQELNAILGAFSSTEKLDAGKKEANLRITQRKSEASTLATEIRAAEERSATLLDITGQAAVIAEAVNGLEKAVRGDETVVAQLGSASLHLGRLQPLQAILEALTLPSLTEVSTLATKVENAETAVITFKSSKLLRALEASMDETAATWNEVVVNFKQGKGFTELFAIMDKALDEDVTDFADRLEKVLGGVATQFSQTKSVNSSIAYLESAASATQAREEFTVQLAELDSQLEVAEAELEELRQELAAEEATKKAAAIKAAVKPGMCPTCGQPLEHVCQ